jgi:integrase
MAGRKRIHRRGKGEGTVSQRKDGTWEGKISLGYDGDGKRRRKTVYGKTQAEVLEKLRQLRQQLSDGVYSDTDKTVRIYLEQWLKEKARTVKPRTAELYREQAERYVYPRIGRVLLVKLTPLQVQNVVGELAEEVGVSTANKVRTLLFQAMKQAVRWQLVPRNVVEAVDKLKEIPKEPQRWTIKEAARFLDSIQGHRLYALFYLAMSTGMRRSELLGLRWCDVQEGAVSVRQALILLGGKPTFGPPKTANGVRRVDITSDVQDVLEAHRQRQQAEREALGDMWLDSGLVFTSEVGTPITPHSLQHTWVNVQRVAGVPRVRLHDLRHLHVSLMIKNGADPAQVADRVGDTLPVVLSVYTHLFEEQRKAAAVSLAELLRGNEPN